MPHEERLTALIAAPPLAPLTEFVAATLSTEHVDRPSRSNARAHDASAIAAAKSAVAEYLRDLGLRDPDVIATESQQIVTLAMEDTVSSALCEAAIRITVKRLEHFLTVLAAESTTPEDASRINCAIAARLPSLLSDFPQAISGQHLSPEVTAQLRKGIAPVVPPVRPKRMKRQRLTLLPASVRRVVEFLWRDGREG